MFINSVYTLKKRQEKKGYASNRNPMCIILEIEMQISEKSSKCGNGVTAFSRATKAAPRSKKKRKLFGCLARLYVSCLSNSCHKEATKWYRKGKIVYVYTLESMNEVEYREPPPRDYYHSLLSFREKWNIRDITWMDGYWDVWYYDDLF